MREPFYFKQFSVLQNSAAMKIGTDSVLLGAWVDVAYQPKMVLDIGTGTGVLALQIAQRSEQSVIHSIEIEWSAYNEALFNFKNSPWWNRLNCRHISFQEYVKENKYLYDLIICNPPYFNDSYKSTEVKRNLARQTTNLNYKELLYGTSKLLSSTATAAFIIPFGSELDFIQIASENTLYPKKITRVRGNVHSELKRSLILLSTKEIKYDIDELCIEIERHVYTQAYLNLVQSFYLKM